MTAKFALIIGNQEYEDPVLRGLRAPEYDVNDLAALLEDPQIGGFAVTRMLDRTFAEVRSAISDFLSDRLPEDTILIYFSGHGIKSRSGTVYLAVRDTRQKNPAALGIDAHFLRTEAQQCYSQRQILILDCCYSGAFAKISKGVADAVDTKSEFMGGFGQVVISATNSVQVGIEADRVIGGDSRYSLFTHYLIEGLQTGQADGAGGGLPDGIVTDLELYEYVYRRLDTTKEQIPQRLVQQYGPPIPIAKNPYFERMPQEIRELLKRVKSTVRSDRAAAARAFGDFLSDPDPDTVTYAQQALLACLSDPVLSVQEAARDSLRLLKPQAPLLKPEPVASGQTVPPAIQEHARPQNDRPPVHISDPTEPSSAVHRQSDQLGEPNPKAAPDAPQAKDLKPNIFLRAGISKLLSPWFIKHSRALRWGGLVLLLVLVTIVARYRTSPIYRYRAEILVHPDDDKARDDLGEALVEAGDLDAAIEVYRDAVAHNPNFHEMHLKLGQLLQKKGDLDGAIVELREAARLGGGPVGFPWMNKALGDALLQKGDKYGALEQYRIASISGRNAPEYINAYNKLLADLQK